MNAEVRSLRTAAETALSEIFASAFAGLPGDSAVAERRRTAFDAFKSVGLPSRRVEDWKYTDLRALMRDAKPIAGAPDGVMIAAARAALAPYAAIDATCVTFVNGRFVEELSDLATGEGVSVTLLKDTLANGAGVEALSDGVSPAGNVAVALNAAFVADGVVVSVAPGVTASRPIHVANVQAGSEHAAYGRVVARVGEGGNVLLIESHIGDAGAHQTNSVVTLDVADGARVELVKIQDESLDTLHLATLAVRLGAKAELKTFALAAGARAARQQIYVSFTGDGSTAEIRGAGFAGATRHLDTTLIVDHDAVGCSSREHFKTALDGEARSVFQGKIVVKPGAQKTDGKMMAQALLLSEGAEADAKPELEIFADDVVCGHGATVGALDDELLFYLKSRGIPQKEAEALMVQAFVGEVIETIEHERLREIVTDRALAWLTART
ncbi:Fe-S cluster assembly protein SufD [Methylopila sp. 73B]|uniref:Fe-S cluster assembly protein SufD n=1 Tax=Methylopila sp. 73B TaxID=1120792 RepID=UPI000399B156|nr:Fe-S cluster assembly protein SufD [Methylopila sp. 73B]